MIFLCAAGILSAIQVSQNLEQSGTCKRCDLLVIFAVEVDMSARDTGRYLQCLTY